MFIITLLITSLAGAIIGYVAAIIIDAVINAIKKRCSKLKKGQSEIVADSKVIYGIVKDAIKEEGRSAQSIDELIDFAKQFEEKTKDSKENLVMFDENGMEITKSDKMDEATRALLSENEGLIEIVA